MDLDPIDIYRLILCRPDLREFFHPKHLSGRDYFYEGLRSAREELGLFDKKVE